MIRSLTLKLAALMMIMSAPQAAAQIGTASPDVFYEQPRTVFEFDENLAPDASDIFGMFARFNPETCAATGEPPRFDELEMVKAPEQGVLIDAGIVNVDNDHCRVPTRLIIYHANPDFTGRDIMAVRDPETNIVIETTFYALGIYKHLNPEVSIYPEPYPRWGRDTE